MSSHTRVALFGGALVLVALAVDILFTLTKNAVPSMVASIATAGLAIVTQALLASRANDAEDRASASSASPAAAPNGQGEAASATSPATQPEEPKP